MTMYTSSCPLASRGCTFTASSELEDVAAMLVQAHMRTGGRFVPYPVLPDEHKRLYSERAQNLRLRPTKEQLDDPLEHAGIPVREA